MSNLTHSKYPSTPYIDLEKSPYIGQAIVITEKMDGENSSLYRDGLHARSLDSRHHPSRDWIKQFHATIAYKIPEHIKICGENLYAQHSIPYENLGSYFFGFGVHDHQSIWSWSDTLNLFQSLGIQSVPILFEGICEKSTLRKVINTLDLTRSEGFVVRPVGEIPLSQFDLISKWVRPNHVQTDIHWAHSEIKANKLKEQNYKGVRAGEGVVFQSDLFVNR